MTTGTPSGYSSRFFRSDQRSQIDRENYKCFSTLAFDEGNEENKIPFGTLEFVNDVSVAPGYSVYFNRQENVQDIILPLNGSLTYKSVLGKKESIAPEHVLFPDPGTDHACEIMNPYDNDWISYLHLGIKKNASDIQPAFTHPVNFTSTNTLASLIPDKAIQDSTGYVGVYTGRTKGLYELKNYGNGVFAYVINGAFEVEERLMESRDGLGLWGSNKIQFESLSENAILLLFEVPLSNN